MDKALAARLMFVFFAASAAGGGLWAVRADSLVRALVGLILSLFGVAGLYLLLAAPLVALMQVLIYAGAVVVLIFFAIMLTRAPAGGEERQGLPVARQILALCAALMPAFILGAACLKYSRQTVETPLEIPAAVLGQIFLGPYVFSFELISLVLFVSMAGAVLLGFERRKSK